MPSTTHPSTNGSEREREHEDVDSDEEGAVERGLARAALGAIKSLRVDTEQRYTALAQHQQTLRTDFEEERRAALRRHAQVLEASATILARLDQTEANANAVKKAVSTVHRVAFNARDEVTALGAQVGRTTSDLAAEDAAARTALDSIHEHEKVQDAALVKVEGVASSARTASALKVTALLAGGAALWKFFEAVYPLLH